MTAIIGIYCRDGVVIGADSSASFAHTPAFRTIEQRVRKLEVIAGQLILASTGAIGLGQRFSDVVERYWIDKKGTGKSHHEVVRELRQLACENFASTGVSKGQCGALLAFPSSSAKRPQLCEFSATDFQPEFKNDNMWFVSMGSGQPITDPFLGLMRRVFWGDTPPLLVDGIFAVTWTLNHVIELNPGGINGPARIAVLDDHSRARELTEDELQEHISNAQGAEKHLAQYKEILKGADAAPIPSAPPPPKAEIKKDR